MASLEEIRETRLKKIEKLQDAGMEPYPSMIARDMSLKQASLEFSELESSNTPKSITGRIVAMRGQGAIQFIVLQEGKDQFQAVIKKDEIEAETLELFNDTVDIGDFISITGLFFTTKRGQPSILAKSWKMASKSLRPLPEKFHGLRDEETRLRQRYLDIFTDPELRDMFNKKAQFWRTMRRFLEDKGFIEVHTPTLETTAGGAEAEPFVTHHNDFNIDVYLRISIGELWQKRLMAAGFSKTYEIGRAYRNEGSSPDHLQEFTNMEFYWAYADYKMGMELVRDMYRHIAQEVFGKTRFETRGHTFDLLEEWKEIKYAEEIKEQTGIDIYNTSEDTLKEYLEEKNIKHQAQTFERLVDVVWKSCRKKISGPAFVVDYPDFMQPLAKRSAENNKIVEQFQVLLGGAEIGKGYSELNDPIDQKERFEHQQKLREAGDKEAMMPDYDFLEMLEHGMPPTCGFGAGERLFAFLMDKPIRETQLFPLLKPVTDNKKDKTTKLAVIMVNKESTLEPWQELNTVAHTSAAFGAHIGKELFWREVISSQDGININLNIQHAILIKESTSALDTKDLLTKAKEVNLEVSEFTREMLETTNDKKVVEQTANKSFQEIEHLGILIFGDKKVVEDLTKDFSLYS